MEYYYKKESVPSLDEAKLLLKEAKELNPGPWVMHSMYVAEGAKLIAAQTDNLNPEVAYILGMFHYIFRIKF